MSGKMEFRDKLSELRRICEENGKQIAKEEVEIFFEEDHLSAEQMGLVFEYLQTQSIVVSGYVREGGRVIDNTGEEETPLAEDDEKFLAHYEPELSAMGEDLLAVKLREILKMAKRMDFTGFLADLVQEGNMGVILAEQEGRDMESSLRYAAECMETFLATQKEYKKKDEKMVAQVRELDEQITKLTEEMGRKISIDDLTEFTEFTEEQIADVLKLAGEDITAE